MGQLIKIVLQLLIDCGAFSYKQQDILLYSSKRISNKNFYIILKENGVDFKNNVSQLLAHAATEGRIETTIFFLEHGGDPNIIIKKFRTTDGNNPEYIYMPLIVRAAEWNAGVDVLSALLKAGADSNARDSDGMTALMQLEKRIEIARQKNSKQWIEELEKRRAVLINAGAKM